MPCTNVSYDHRALTLVGESDRKLVKLAMKHAPPESIKQRVIPPDVINEVTAELEELEGEVKAVQREEKEEKEVSLYCSKLVKNWSLTGVFSHSSIDEVIWNSRREGT